MGVRVCNACMPAQAQAVVGPPTCCPNNSNDSVLQTEGVCSAQAASELCTMCTVGRQGGAYPEEAAAGQHQDTLRTPTSLQGTHKSQQGFCSVQAVSEVGKCGQRAWQQAVLGRQLDTAALAAQQDRQGSSLLQPECMCCERAVSVLPEHGPIGACWSEGRSQLPATVRAAAAQCKDCKVLHTECLDRAQAASGRAECASRGWHLAGGHLPAARPDAHMCCMHQNKTIEAVSCVQVLRVAAQQAASDDQMCEESQAGAGPACGPDRKFMMDVRKVLCKPRAASVRARNAAGDCRIGAGG